MPQKLWAQTSNYRRAKVAYRADADKPGNNQVKERAVVVVLAAVLVVGREPLAVARVLPPAAVYCGVRDVVVR